MTISAQLPLRPLGATGLLVNSLCIGCAPLGDSPETFSYSVSLEQALETIRALFRSLVNFADTAASYGSGESERRLGLVIRELGGLPSGFVLATKADRDLTTGDFSGEQMRRSIEGSLERLGLAHLALVYLHDPENTTFEAAMAHGGPVEVLLNYKEQGVIEHLGLAGGPIDLMTRFVETGLFEAAISHNRYTLLNTEADAFWDTCVHHGVAALNAAPYGGGMLVRGPSAFPRYMYGQASEDLLKRAFQLETLCTRYQIPLAAVALQFSLRDPRIASTIVGVSRPERIPETVVLAEYPIPAALWDELAAL
jgi:D-threo-aldose 1-dehydrogenase